MSDLGERLREARQARGVSLREIAASTKISVVALEALERNDYSRLPGGIFGRSFVRAYAVAVGLEPETAVTEFKTGFERWEQDTARNATRPEITPDDLQFMQRQRAALRTLRLVLVVVAVLALAALGYVVLTWWPRAATASGPAKPARLASATRSLPAPATRFGPLGSHLR